MLTNIDNLYLAPIRYEDTIPFIPPVQSGKVIKVYDGDTITIASKILNVDTIYRFSVRIRGIDSPEIRGKTANEKELAKTARDALTMLIMNQIVTLRNVDTEKYGRILADVYFGDISISEWMLHNHYAVKYDGGTKMIPEEWN